MSGLDKINFKAIDQRAGDMLVMVMTKETSAKKTDAETATGGLFSKALNVHKFTGKKGELHHLTGLGQAPYNNILVVGMGALKDLDGAACETVGGQISAKLRALKSVKPALLVACDGNKKLSSGEMAAHLAHGLRLGCYRFDKYMTKKNDDEGDKETDAVLEVLNVCTEDVKGAKAVYKSLQALGDGVLMARDLVNEPANVLNPDEFAKRLKSLSKLGIEVTVLGEKELKANKMHALLGVGQGSMFGSYLVVMEWKGDPKSKDQPVALVGKGVSFDTGGISIKPSGGMEDMKGDMGGAAAVTGAMVALAKRKAKANVVGVVGLVENMPDAKAQRPGDIVTSMSGQTIEIINTDAEGRLVLADALCYTNAKFAPKWMVNLATLTGAIIVALGKEYAGLFSSDDDLAKQIKTAGDQSSDKVWRLPLHESYDKMINSKFADMKNTGGRGAGSITAAQFLKRHTKDTPWAHIDVAGTAMSSNKTPTNQSWGSGFGVALLNQLVRNSEEL